ncbi:SIS domain-containing protein [Aquimarina addita]|uniref:SIS domain-containing protein n=1 Tax=Aquimarina addita TaxID=870485 RepID=A0ABP6UKI5_9FLAO
MKYLNIDEITLKENGAIHTAKEIAGQPELWEAIFEKLIFEQKEVEFFLDTVFKKVKKIILTGAGTSAYIAYSVEGNIQRKNKTTTVSVATTHLVSHPQDYFEPSTPTLLISFARSGNSPESVASIELANKHIQDCYHLIITCNPDGSLAKQAPKNNSYVFILPPEADDKSLAMTGSYSGMLLSALLINDIKNIGSLKQTIAQLKNYGTALLTDHLASIKKAAQLPFNRAVFLGSGPQYGTAMESHLKLQELTDGQVICKNDSYLGFRHGPKAVVDQNTLMVYYFSNNAEALRYEKDLVNAMDQGSKPLYEIGLSENAITDITIDQLIILKETKEDFKIDEAYLAVCNIVLGQLLGFFNSLERNLQPDTPSISGAISRVVKGVIIY